MFVLCMNKIMCMESPIIRVEHLWHRYTMRWAIEDINFEIEDNSVVGLLGSNGAGKSTTMNIICGVLKQTRGRVLIQGIDTLRNPIGARKLIGFLPQKPPLYPDMSVEEYLNFCAHIHDMNAKTMREDVRRVEERCGIFHVRERLIRNLSGGFQQRVGIAQAILHNPKLVILDEPTNGLDPNQILEVRALIKEIAEDHTVLLSTHILGEVQATCSQIKMIEDGQLVFSGTVEEFDNYIEPNSLHVSFDLPPSPEELLRLPGIQKVESLGDHVFRLYYDGERDSIKQLIKESVARGWDMVEAQVEKSSMEAVFAKLSRK